MKWYSKLYVGDSIAGKAGKIKWKIRHRAGTIDIYVISFASNPANELMQRGYPKKHMKVIGLAKGYEEALQVVTTIIEETYQNTGDVDVWNYLKEKRRNSL